MRKILHCIVCPWICIRRKNNSSWSHFSVGPAFCERPNYRPLSSAWQFLVHSQSHLCTTILLELIQLQTILMKTEFERKLVQKSIEFPKSIFSHHQITIRMRTSFTRWWSAFAWCGWTFLCCICKIIQHKYHEVKAFKLLYFHSKVISK